MADEKPDKKSEATPEGAVEVDEQDLDKAEGGLISSYSINPSASTDPLMQKVAPTVIVGAGPGAGPHVAPEKKI